MRRRSYVCLALISRQSTNDSANGTFINNINSSATTITASPNFSNEVANLNVRRCKNEEYGMRMGK